MKCCHAPGYETKQCMKTGKLNKFKGMLDHRAAGNRVFTGLHTGRQIGNM